MVLLSVHYIFASLNGIWSVISLMEEKIRSSGYPLSKRTLIIKSKLLLWRQQDYSVDQTIYNACLMCVRMMRMTIYIPKNIPKKVGLRNQLKIRPLSFLIIVRSKKFNLSPRPPISIVKFNLGTN